MRYVIIGAGAVGGSIGACLHASGHDVVLVARGSHFSAIAESGLRLLTPDGEETHRIPVVERAKDAEISSGDLVLLAVKSQHTEQALSALEGFAPVSTPIFCLQNGVVNERSALRRFSNVYGGLVIVPASFLSPGRVSVAAAPTFGICDVGRYPSGRDGIVETFAEALNSSRWSSFALDDIMRWKYAKLLENLPNAVQVALGLHLRDSSVAAAAREEGAVVLKAAGIDVILPDAIQARRTASLTNRPVPGQERGGASTWQSIERGAGSIETDYLNGEITLLGRLHGIATPVNTLLQSISFQVMAGLREPGSYSEEEFLAALE